MGVLEQRRTVTILGGHAQPVVSIADLLAKVSGDPSISVFGVVSVFGDIR